MPPKTGCYGTGTQILNIDCKSARIDTCLYRLLHELLNLLGQSENNFSVHLGNSKNTFRIDIHCTLFTMLYFGAMVLHSFINGVKLMTLFQKSTESLPHLPTYTLIQLQRERVFLAKTSLQDIFICFFDIW